MEKIKVLEFLQLTSGSTVILLLCRSNSHVPRVLFSGRIDEFEKCADYESLSNRTVLCFTAYAIDSIGIMVE